LILFIILYFSFITGWTHLKKNNKNNLELIFNQNLNWENYIKKNRTFPTDDKLKYIIEDNDLNEKLLNEDE